MKISVIIPNYNGERLLKKNLLKVIEAVYEYKHGEKEIIITDDASTDDSIGFLNDFISKQNLPIDVEILANSKNEGFSSNVNKGVSAASGEIVILINTDVFPEKGFLDPLIKHFEDKDVFAVGCMDKSIENGKVVLRGRGIGKWQRGFLVHNAGSLNKDNTLWVSGGSSAFRRLEWENLGGFDPLYNPFYWEDIDLSFRALKSGLKIVFEKDSVVIHQHEEGTIKTFYGEGKIRSVAYRNQFIFVWKNVTDNFLILSHVIWLPYHIVSSIVRGDIQFLLGFFQAVTLIPKIFNHRLTTKKLFIKSDREVVENLTE